MLEPPRDVVARFAIIGLGPRGLIILERIIAFARRNRGMEVSVAIVDPGEPGVGSHLTDQPDYLLLNTVAGQLSMFPGRIDPEVDDHFGPSLFEWCLARWGQGSTGQLTCHGSPRPTDFLPRRLLGEYLQWFAQYLLSLAPSWMSTSIHSNFATDIQPVAGEERYVVSLDNGALMTVDEVFLTIGHPRRGSGQPQGKPLPGRLRAVYPLPSSLTAAGPGAHIIMHGLGLSAMDAMASAINLWGGAFRAGEDGSLTYIPSGREGHLTFLTRTGLAYRGRPETAFGRKPHEPRILTSDFLDALTKEFRPGTLDFASTVMPLMKLEMRAAYEESLSRGPAIMSDEFRLARHDDRGGERAGFPERDRAFEPDLYLMLSAPEGLTRADYDAWILRQIVSDITESRSGVPASPVKAALEVWRDLREQLRVIIDSPALSPVSRASFFRHYAPLINRLVRGPEWRRLAELHALLQPGISDIVWLGRSGLQSGPDDDLRRDVHLIEFEGRVAASGFERTDSPLLRRLVDRGLAAKCNGHAGTDGILVDRSGNLVSGDNKVIESMWAFGPPTEGSSYYNHYIPSPGQPCRAYVDAHRAVKKCFERHAQQT